MNSPKQSIATVLLLCVLVVTACDPGEGFRVDNTTDTPVTVKLRLASRNTWSTLRLDAGSHITSGWITSRPAMAPLLVQAFDPNEQRVFCRVYQPIEMSVGPSGYRTWVIVIGSDEDNCGSWPEIQDTRRIR